MIRLQGARRLTFDFPAERPAAFDFYCTTVDQLVSFLPHIELVKSFAPDYALLAYHARELAYDIQMVCEVALECDRPEWVIRVVTRENGLRIMPGRAVDRIANAITGRRIEEIARSFIENSITAYVARNP